MLDAAAKVYSWSSGDQGRFSPLRLTFKSSAWPSPPGGLFKYMLNLDLYLIDGPVTPLVTGGAGFLTTTGILGGSDRGETNFAYSAGAGVRWDIDKHLFTKLVYRATWSKFEGTAEAMLFHGVFLSAGWIF